MQCFPVVAYNISAGNFLHRIYKAFLCWYGFCSIIDENKEVFEMRKRLYIIALFLSSFLLVHSGCYTVIATRKLKRKDWRKKHRYQYFSKTRWGKVWNSYYWSPSLKDAFGKPLYPKSSSRKKDLESSEETYHSTNSHYTCIDNCISSSTDDCISSCLFDFLLGSNYDSENDTIPPSDERPKRRRGI